MQAHTDARARTRLILCLTRAGANPRACPILVFVFPPALWQCGIGEGAAQQAQGVKGECPSGGKHVYKFGKCTKCGATEGVLAEAPVKAKPREEVLPESGTCPKGGGHTWKFGKCSKCGTGEGAFMQAQKEEEVRRRGY